MALFKTLFKMLTTSTLES